jgi:hypothetical protein
VDGNENPVRGNEIMNKNERWHDHFAGCIAEQADGEYGDAIGITTASEQEFFRTGERGDLIAWVPSDRMHQENARLIAAAPDLLESIDQVCAALETLMAQYGDRMCEADRTSRLAALGEARRSQARAEGFDSWDAAVNAWTVQGVEE